MKLIKILEAAKFVCNSDDFEKIVVRLSKEAEDWALESRK